MIDEIKEHYEIRQDGTIYSTKSNKILVTSYTEKGYKSITLVTNSGNTKTYLVHRLIATKYIHNPDGLPQVNHINGIKDDNRVENLEWVDNQTNRDHAIANGLIPKTEFEKGSSIGELNDSAKLTDDIVIELREKQLTYKEYCKEYNIELSKNGYDKMMRGYTWKHIAMDKVRPKKEKNPPLLQYSKDGELVAEHKTITEAQDASGADRAVIRKCCIGKAKTAGGYIWKYKGQ